MFRIYFIIMSTALVMTGISLPAWAGKARTAAPHPVADGEADAPSHLEKLYQERAYRDPQDVEAFEGMAMLQMKRADYADAIDSYRRVLQLTPHDREARVALGRALAFSGDYLAATRNYQELLQENPYDTDALEGVARVEMWSGRSAEAAPVFEQLAAIYPSNPDYALGLARAEMNLRQYVEAQWTLARLLEVHPHNHDALLQLAEVDLNMGELDEAFKRFNNVIKEDPANEEALEGNVRVAYFRGDLAYADHLGTRIVEDDPHNVDALLLLANIERAMRHRRQARIYLQRAETLNPGSKDAQELEDGLRRDTQPSLHTSAAFSREVASGNPASGEDLSTFGYDTTWQFSAVPHSDSALSLDYLPSQSPAGGVAGAVGPSAIFYRQTTTVTPRLTLRSGAGLMRFGPGELTGVATQPQPIVSAGIRPMGFVGASYVYDSRLTLDVTADRSAVTYTPTAVRLGVMEDRVWAGVNYRFNSATDLRFEPFVSDDFSISYAHSVDNGGPTPVIAHAIDHNRGAGAELTFNRHVFTRHGMSFDAGYSGLAYELQGGSQKPYLGIFNPSFYQRQYFTTHLRGPLRGPLGYDFSSGTGVQQIELGTPYVRALLFNPALTWKANSRLTWKLGYTHYDSSQSLGTLRGNAVMLSTDWK